jgi:hypothetical protein
MPSRREAAQARIEKKIATLTEKLTASEQVTQNLRRQLEDLRGEWAWAGVRPDRSFVPVVVQDFFAGLDAVLGNGTEPDEEDSPPKKPPRRRRGTQAAVLEEQE